MSINWVMLTDSRGFTPLSGEKSFFTSSSRTSLSLQSLNKYPGKEPFNIQSPSGTLYLTNRRVLYIPSTSSETFQSFAAPLLNLHDSHVVTPWFGPNMWTALVQPVAGGGIPPQHAALELKITFKEGGAYDFSTQFERLKEILHQAVETARDSGQVASSGPAAGVNLDNVNLEELPAYEGPGDAQRQATGAPPLVDVPSQAPSSPAPASQVAPQATLPSEPPPEYEEVQRDSVADELERRLRQM